MNNNNSSMATVVETFLVEETIDLIHDNEALEKWNERVNELNLTGQLSVVKKDKSPIPFLWMNFGLVATFETLCPRKVMVEEYDKTPIPVELLDLVSLSIKEQYFDCIKVWYNDQQIDPAIIGYTFPPEHKDMVNGWGSEHYSQKYLIGRWADVKASLDQLIERAKILFTKSESIRLKKEIRDRSRELEDLESNVEARFGASMPNTDNLPF